MVVSVVVFIAVLSVVDFIVCSIFTTVALEVLYIVYSMITSSSIISSSICSM